MKNNESIGFEVYSRLERLKQDAETLGFKLGKGKFSHSNDKLVLFPGENRLPIYVKDAELYYGDLQKLEGFLDGIKWCQTYLYLIKVSSENKIKKAEQTIRNRQLKELIEKSDNDHGK